jgi:hypothetical protein
MLRLRERFKTEYFTPRNSQKIEDRIQKSEVGTPKTKTAPSKLQTPIRRPPARYGLMLTEVPGVPSLGALPGLSLTQRYAEVRKGVDLELVRHLADSAFQVVVAKAKSISIPSRSSAYLCVRPNWNMLFPIQPSETAKPLCASRPWVARENWSDDHSLGV